MVAVTSTAKLDYKMDYLVVRTAEEIKRIHLSEISVLMIESTSVSLTAYLICELSRRKIDIIFCDEKRLPCGSFIPYYGSHDTSLKYKNQINWSDEIKAFVWAEIVRAKISGQLAVLDKYKKSEKELLAGYLPQIEPGDPTNREGHAAKVYFNALFGMDFSRSQENSINAALNYGYSIILSVFAREITANGYFTQYGIFHDNMFNQYNLACDFMEPFRPFIDFSVSKMNLASFEHDEKMELVRVLNKTVKIDNKIQYLLNAIKISVKSLFDALNERDISLIRFPSYELQIYETDCIL